MRLVIVLTKEVPDAETAQQLFDIVKDKLADHPEVKITGQVSDNLILNGVT